MNLLSSFFSHFLLGDAKSLSSATPGALPRFLSRGHTYRAVVGDTLVLPCEVENLGKLTNHIF